MDSSFICHEVLRNLRKITRAIDLHSKRLAQEYGLTGPQAIIMQEIQQGGAVPVSSLAKSVSLSHATVTDILNRLSKRGMVVRTRDHVDKRRMMVSLTEQGAQLLTKTPSLLQDQFISRFEDLEEWEQTLILSSLQRVATFMNAEDLDASPVLTSGHITRKETEI